MHGLCKVYGIKDFYLINHFAVRQYKKYKLAAGKTAKSILISCGARLAPFDIKELRDLMEYDDLELDTLGEKKTALFVIISDTDATALTALFPYFRFLPFLRHPLWQIPVSSVPPVSVKQYSLGEKKTALFVIISDTDATFNFVVSIMYSQLFNLLCDKADDIYNGTAV